ncbi:MAG: four helix bundle protein [bacterium]|nr:four helix bundle protein [bacterium]
MAFAKRFEELEIWQHARALVTLVYNDFAYGTAGHKDALFCNQITAAVLSIMNNISEGFERHTPADFARFLDIAKGSCGEVRSMYYAAQDLNYVRADTAALRRSQAESIAKGIAALTRHFRTPATQ